MSTRYFRAPLVIGFTLILALWNLSNVPAGAIDPLTSYAVVVLAPDREARTALVHQGFVPEGIDLMQGTVTLFVTAQERERLRALGWRVVKAWRLEDFPPTEANYHNYEEMVAELQAIAAAHPEIVQVSTFGQSVEGRDLYVVKISDNVTQDESARDPGVLFFANIHAREHLTLEQALWIVHHLVENYGRDGAVTNLVNQREVWIIPNLNPDGTEYDISKGFYRYWRKNRRPNPGGTYGVDLNRNFGYRWGCCRGSSSVPSSETYRGPTPFSEPETQALRDFLLDHPSIRVSLNFHSYSELVLWPYGYTYEDVPEDMDTIDHQVLVRAGHKMAQLSGYTPMQISDLYIADGVADDWLYGTLGVLSWAVELYPRTNPPGFYPPDEVIPEQTARNRAMVEYFISLADEPRKVLGLAGDLITPTVSLTPVVLSGHLTREAQVTLLATATDNEEVTLVAFRDGDAPLGLVTSTPYVLTVTLGPGDHTLYADAYDRAHNVGTSLPVTISVGTPPTLTPTPEPSTYSNWLPLAGVHTGVSAANRADTP